jgi:acyl-CoA thioesterase-2
MDDPTAGAWELDELFEVFDVAEAGSGRFRAAAGPERLPPEERSRAMVEGHQLLGQGLVAASRSASDRFVKSAHMVFARAASAAAPVELEVDRIHDGRSFSSLSVRALQGERLCAQGLFLLDTDEPDCIRHAAEMPTVAGPDEAEPFASPVRGRELRMPEGADYARPDIAGPPALDVWVRYAHAPDDPAIRQAVLAHLGGPFTIGTSLRPHPGFGEAQAHRTLSTGILSLSVRFHDPCALDDWLLVAHESVHAGRGLCDGVGRIFERSGRLVASFAQEGLLRRLPAERVAATDVRSRL